MIRFGYKASAEQFAPLELLRYGIQAEQQGFDSVFVSDHLQPWRHDGGHAPAALPWVARPSPPLGCRAPAGFRLGVGWGEPLNGFPLGLQWREGRERFARLKEAVT